MICGVVSDASSCYATKTLSQVRKGISRISRCRRRTEEEASVERWTAGTSEKTHSSFCVSGKRNAMFSFTLGSKKYLSNRRLSKVKVNRERMSRQVARNNRPKSRADFLLLNRFEFWERKILSR